ncbi:hypothetical protein [Leclercia sp. AS011]|uniref:hypothetical protein n=1 Tax=Leclercia sp. AS011 TaxID=3081257 RepID=UPI0030189E88
MNTVTLSNGKTYRKTSANIYEVKTIRVHAETGLAIWARVTSEKIKAELETVLAIEAVEIDKAFVAFWRECETTDVLKAATLYAQILDEATAINNEIDSIVSYAGNTSPVQIDGDINWIFDAAVSVWHRHQGIEIVHTVETVVTTTTTTITEIKPVIASTNDYDNLVKTVEESTHQNKVKLFCEVTGQSSEMAELMLSRSDGFLLGAIKSFQGVRDAG